MKTKHTPGPWQIARHNPNTGYCEVETVERGQDLPDQGYHIATVSAWATEPGPNARLIAAAPDLLAACDAALALIRRYKGHNVTLDSQELAAVTALDAAIASAWDDCTCDGDDDGRKGVRRRHARVSGAQRSKGEGMSDRNETIKTIRAALKRRSGKIWSVKGGSGTAWGWIRIDAPPARRTWHCYLPEGLSDHPQNYLERDTGKPGGFTSPTDRADLAALLGLDGVHCQGHSIPAGLDYYREYIDRAEGRKPSKLGVPYWD